METVGTGTAAQRGRSEHRVAVVVPCYNDGRYIANALESLEGQEPHELVVVDDGSDERETLGILEGLRESGIRVASQANAGLGPARMAGVRATSAPMIHFLDSDDLLVPNALTTLADTLEAHSDAAAAWGTYRSFGAAECFFPTAPTLDPWRVTYLNEIPGTCLVRRQAIEAVGGWDHVGYEDWDFWMKLAEHGFAGVGIPNTTLLYRAHEAPRLMSSSLVSHDDHFKKLHERHPRLLSQRRRNWRESATPLRLKLLLPAIDLLPLSARRKRQLWGMSRYLVQPEMCSDCYRSPLSRLRERTRPGSRRSRDPESAAR